MTSLRDGGGIEKDAKSEIRVRAFTNEVLHLVLSIYPTKPRLVKKEIIITTNLLRESYIVSRMAYKLMSL